MNTAAPYPYTNANNGRRDFEWLIESEGQISQSVDQNVVGTGTSEGALNQIVLPPFYESNAANSNGAAQTVFVPQDHNVYPNSRYSPPPPYDSHQVFNPCVQPTQYPQLQRPQQQNVQYIHQQRLQYPQQESLQYNEGISYYPQHQRIPYPYQRDGNLPTPPIKRGSCSFCLRADAIYCFFCVVPICLLICLLIFVAQAASDNF